MCEVQREVEAKRKEVQLVDLHEYEPLILVTLEEFFLLDLFKKVTINMTSGFELEDE